MPARDQQSLDRDGVVPVQIDVTSSADIGSAAAACGNDHERLVDQAVQWSLDVCDRHGQRSTHACAPQHPEPDQQQPRNARGHIHHETGRDRSSWRTSPYRGADSSMCDVIRDVTGGR